MARIDISMEINDRNILDPDSEDGLTEEGYDSLVDHLAAFGTDIDIRGSLRG